MAEKGATEPKNPAKRGKSVQKPGGARGLAPFEEMERMMNRMERFVEEFFPGRWRGGAGWRPFDEMERFFEEGLPRGWMRPFGGEWPSWGRLAPFEGRWPRVDVIDRDDEIVVHAEVPGVGKDDLDVSMTDDTVTIKGKTTREEKEEEEGYHRREMARGEFSRTVRLPVAVDGSQATATFKDGVMELTLPKLEKAKRRTIKVE